MARVGAAMLALSALAGCQQDPDEKAPPCPRFIAPTDGQTLTRYDGRGRDLSNLVLSARIVDTPGACKGQLGISRLTAHATVQMLVTRGPAATSREADVPYNVAVFRDGVKLEEKQYVQHVVFPPNVDSVQVTGDRLDFAFPSQRGLGGTHFTVYVVLQLSPEELAGNRRALGQK